MEGSVSIISQPVCLGLIKSRLFGDAPISREAATRFMNTYSGITTSFADIGRDELFMLLLVSSVLCCQLYDKWPSNQEVFVTIKELVAVVSNISHTEIVKYSKQFTVSRVFASPSKMIIFKTKQTTSTGFARAVLFYFAFYVSQMRALFA